MKCWYICNANFKQQDMEATKRKYTIRVDYDSKVSRMLVSLKADEQLTISDFARLFEVSERSIYNMINEVRHRGYRVSIIRNVPRLESIVGPVGAEGDVYLSTDEADLLLYLIHHLSAAHPHRQSLTSLLGRDLKDRLQPYFCHVDEDLYKVSRIAEAIRGRTQLVLKGYRSGHSGTIADRLVEPVEWSANYRQLHAYDVEKRAMRTFVVSRMEGVEPTGVRWKYEAEHVVPEVDCFWMSGEPEEVTLRMDLLALNLLHEEYPLSRQNEVRDSGDESLPYETTLEVRSSLGVGRFVKGLEGHVVIEQDRRNNSITK